MPPFGRSQHIPVPPTRALTLPLALSLALALSSLPGCATSSAASTQAAGDPPELVIEQYSSELVVEELLLGEGPVVKRGDRIEVRYSGWLTDGRRFDSNVGKEPLSFRLGGGQVIRGWDEGLEGMRVGGKRKLTIPPSKAYGDRGMGGIPPKSTLLFEVELLSIL